MVAPGKRCCFTLSFTFRSTTTTLPSSSTLSPPSLRAAAVHEYVRLCEGSAQMSRGSDKDAAGAAWLELVINRPGQDASGEVVDHGVDVGFGPFERFEDRTVHMSRGVRPIGTYADLRFGGVDAKSRPEPFALPDPLGPGRGVGKDLPDPLSVECQRPDRHVTIVG